jgi:hypothetical protein
VTGVSPRRNQRHENLYAHILSRDQPGIFAIRDSSTLFRGVNSVRCDGTGKRLAVDLAGSSAERGSDQMSRDHNPASSRIISAVREKILGAPIQKKLSGRE